MKYKLYTTPRFIKLACYIIRKNSLCYHDGSMIKWSRNSNNIQCIALSYFRDENGLVFTGAAIKRKILSYDDRSDGPYNVGVFVKYEYRRQKIGTNLISRIKNICDDIKPWTVEDRALQFYRKQGLAPVPEPEYFPIKYCFFQTEFVNENQK